MMSSEELNTDHVLYDLNVIRGAYQRLSPEERTKGFLSTLIERYSMAVLQLDDPVLRRLYDLLYVKCNSREKCACLLNCDRRTIYRYNLALLTALAVELQKETADG